MRIFVDTWAWYALSDTTDTDHEAARFANEEMLDEEHTFVTTNFVIAEATTLIRYHVSHAAAVRFRRLVAELADAELVEVIRISEQEEDEALRIFENYADQDFSFVDCTSFAIMRVLEITTAFTGDKHFATMGFILRP